MDPIFSQIIKSVTSKRYKRNNKKEYFTSYGGTCMLRTDTVCVFAYNRTDTRSNATDRQFH